MASEHRKSDESAVDEARKDFLLHEYDSLRKEIEQDKGEMRAVERYAVLGTAAIWTWLTSMTNLPTVYRLAWWLPFFLVVLAGLRVYTTWELMKLKGRYIKSCEQRLGVQGWEHFLDRQEGFIIKYSPRLLWSILVPVTIAWPIVVELYRG